MTILVDAKPTQPEECLFMEFVEAVHEDALERAETCKDCGGLVFDDEDISIASICTLTGQPCSLEENGECNCLSVGYVTKF